MYFINEEHEKFYKEKIGQVKQLDCYTKSLIYLLSSNQETRSHFKEIYEIKTNEINLESLKSPWQTSTSLSICRLAFNLFGDIISDDYENGVSYLYTVSSILKNLNIKNVIEAFKLRFC